MCDPNASCVDTQKEIASGWTRWSCACNPGFVGNGLSCFNATTGIKSAEPTDQLSVQVTLTTEFLSVPDGPVPAEVLGPSDSNLLDAMDGMLDTGVLCPGCQQPIATCAA